MNRNRLDDPISHALTLNEPTLSQKILDTVMLLNALQIRAKQLDVDVVFRCSTVNDQQLLKFDEIHLDSIKQTKTYYDNNSKQ